MRKIIYWLSPLSVIIIFSLMSLFDSQKFGFDFRQTISPLIFGILPLCFFVLTIISFRKIVNNEVKKRAWLSFVGFTLLTTFVIFLSVIISWNLLNYDFGCTDFLCGIEIILFPIGYLFCGSILNLIMVLTRKKSTAKVVSSFKKN